MQTHQAGRYEPSFPIGQIDVEWNPRPESDFHDDEMKSFTESVRQEGVKQPIWLRALPNGRAGLIAGERRLRASKACKYSTIPALVHDAADAYQALKLKALENDQRKDLDPLAQGECFERMVNPPKGAEHKPRSITDVAKEIGRSPGYVAQRMHLIRLGSVGRKLLAKKAITFSQALEIARIGRDELRHKCEKEVQQDTYLQDDPRELSAHIQQNYFLRLADATFDKTDAALVPVAGSCITCPKRSANQADLFDEVKKDDLCLDAKCFEAKKNADWEGKVAAAAKRGVKPLDPEKSGRLFAYDGKLSYSAPFVKLSDKCEGDPKKRTYAQLIGKDADVVLARDDEGNAHELVSKKEATAGLKREGHKFGLEPKLSRSSSSAQDVNSARESRRRNAITKAVIGAIVEKAPLLGTGALADVLFPAIADFGRSDPQHGAVLRRGWGEKKTYQDGAKIKANYKKLDAAGKLGLVVELIVGDGAYWARGSAIASHLARAAEAAGVDLKAVKKAALAELEPKKAKKPAKNGGAK